MHLRLNIWAVTFHARATHAASFQYFALPFYLLVSLIRYCASPTLLRFFTCAGFSIFVAHG